MPQLTRQVKINAPKEKTWDILADWGAVSNWAPTITESHITKGEPIYLGKDDDMSVV